MTFALFTLTFQGEPTVVGPLDPDDRREAQREAFPRSPPRNATGEATYKARKIAPLRSGRLMLSAISNRSENDAHGRPVLRATGCVLDREALGGPMRDPVAVLAAVAAWSPEQSLEDFEAAVAEGSAWANDAAFAAIRTRLTEDLSFHARVAAALSRSHVNVLADGADDALAQLGPALTMLPAQRLFALTLATGSIDGETREAVLALQGPADPVLEDRGSGLLGGLLGRRRNSHGPVTIDLRQRSITPEVEAGPVELVQAITDSTSWPGMSDRERFRLLMASVDASWLTGSPATPFELSPALDELRRTVKRIEDVSRKLEGWR